MEPLSLQSGRTTLSRLSLDSLSSVSTTSLVFDRLQEQHQLEAVRPSKRPPLATTQRAKSNPFSTLRRYLSSNRDAPKGGMRLGYQTDFDHVDSDQDIFEDDSLKEQDEPLSDIEASHAFLRVSTQPPLHQLQRHGVGRRCRLIVMVIASTILLLWVLTMLVFISQKAAHRAAKGGHDPDAVSSATPVTLSQVLDGYYSPAFQQVRWIAGPGGEDGLLLSQGVQDKDYLIVENILSLADITASDTLYSTTTSRTLMRDPWITYSGKRFSPDTTWPSPDLSKVLLVTDKQSNWRHSSTGRYWILDVPSQQPQPLVPDEPDAAVQLAIWSPRNDAIVFVRNNNLFLRRLTNGTTDQITRGDSANVFYGVPDWVYEEEVLGGPAATWWSPDGLFLAFLRTNETEVPNFPIEYFFSRPAGTSSPNRESYPRTRFLKYPKAGAPNPIVDVQFYDLNRAEVFTVHIDGDFADDDRIINAVLWVGPSQVLIKETNRVSDILRVVLVDVTTRKGSVVRTVDVSGQDGGWFEISKHAVYVPADPANGRPHDGYVDTVINGDGNHLAYFVPPHTPDPTVLLTSGPWEVDGGPAAVDLAHNLVYFVATRESSIQRHVYSVRLDATDLQAITDTSTEGYYDIAFSAAAGYALLTYRGPLIPWQRIIRSPANDAAPIDHLLEDNVALASRVASHQLPLQVYGTLEVDGISLNYVEHRPAHFDPSRRYPVLFFQYSGPGSQMVSKQFAVSFESYVVSSLGYIAVTVDGRGTGFIGRRARIAVRGRLGHWEAHDQVAAAQHWAGLPYVDPARLAIWGWSFGGFTALKALELDAGRTFSYGMAVAPVTDWRFYDSIYTERFMRTPALNPAGYTAAAVTNASALGANVRFLLVHGTADDNVHTQNTLALLDALDLAEVENYDVHVFPDSDHSIHFHNAHPVVYHKLSNWMINAFNGEWLRVKSATPKQYRA